MNLGLIEVELRLLASESGIRACALIEGASGLVLHASGNRSDDSLWEAAVEYWRLYQRMQSNFEVLGALKGTMLLHLDGKLVLLPFGRSGEMVLACVADHDGVDWRDWQKAVRTMAKRLGLA